jgi:hypothetical protein
VEERLEVKRYYVEYVTDRGVYGILGSTNLYALVRWARRKLSKTRGWRSATIRQQQQQQQLPKTLEDLNTYKH